MPNFDVSIQIQGDEFTLFPGKVYGSELYSLVNISPDEYMLMLDTPNEVDIPVSPADIIIVTGGENFVISKPCSGISDIPALNSPIPFSLNGDLFTGDDSFMRGKVTTEELAQKINKSTSDTRFILDLDGLADQVLPNKCQIVVGGSWSVITTPVEDEGAEIDLEDCSCGGEPPRPSHRYRIRVDDKKFTVDVPHMLGRDILKLAGFCSPEQHALYQKFRGGETKIIAPDEKVDFTAPGVERFVTIPLDMTEGFEPRRQFQLPPDDVMFLDSLGMPWEAVLESNVRRVLIHEFPVPSGYNVGVASINMRIESGYPEAQIDMVYFYPSLARNDNKPIGAITTDQFDSKQWQRWSRHRTPSNPWRPGIDNVSTHVSAIQSWLQLELLK